MCPKYDWSVLWSVPSCLWRTLWFSSLWASSRAQFFKEKGDHPLLKGDELYVINLIIFPKARHLLGLKNRPFNGIFISSKISLSELVHKLLFSSSSSSSFSGYCLELNFFWGEHNGLSYIAETANIFNKTILGG